MRSIDIKVIELFKYREFIWMRITPGKRLFHSTTIHEVINRGDIFAVRLNDGLFSVITGTDQVARVKSKIDKSEVTKNLNLS